MTSNLHGQDWEQFSHPDGLFSLAYPKRWRRVPPVSSCAALSCASLDKLTLLEVVCMHSPVARRLDPYHIVDIVVSGIAATPYSTEFRDGRILEQRELARGSTGKCVRIIISFTERPMNLTTDYFVAGSSQDAIYVALKTLTSKAAFERPDFERLLATLYTPWLDQTGVKAAIGALGY